MEGNGNHGTLLGTLLGSLLGGETMIGPTPSEVHWQLWNSDQFVDEKKAEDDEEEPTAVEGEQLESAEATLAAGQCWWAASSSGQN